MRLVVAESIRRSRGTLDNPDNQGSPDIRGILDKDDT